MKATKEQLYAAIQREREYQKQKWPETGKPLDLYGYMIVAREELREARLAFCKHAGNEEALRELLQVVAVGVAWHESRGWEDAAWQNLGALYASRTYSLPCWLEVMEDAFSKARKDLAESLERPRWAVLIEEHTRVEGQEAIDIGTLPMSFIQIIAMGMRALVEHGVVEREEFSRTKTGD